MRAPDSKFPRTLFEAETRSGLLSLTEPNQHQGYGVEPWICQANSLVSPFQTAFTLTPSSQ